MVYNYLHQHGSICVKTCKFAFLNSVGSDNPVQLHVLISLYQNLHTLTDYFLTSLRKQYLDRVDLAQTADAQSDLDLYCTQSLYLFRRTGLYKFTCCKMVTQWLKLLPNADTSAADDSWNHCGKWENVYTFIQIWYFHL